MHLDSSSNTQTQEPQVSYRDRNSTQFTTRERSGTGRAIGEISESTSTTISSAQKTASAPTFNTASVMAANMEQPNPDARVPASISSTTIGSDATLVEGPNHANADLNQNHSSPLYNPYSPPPEQPTIPTTRQPQTPSPPPSTSPPTTTSFLDNASNTSHATTASTSKSNTHPPPSSTSHSNPVASMQCAACQLPMTGQFVKALGTVYHLDCFRCGDCGNGVAQKFFPIEGADGKQQPLCETDYFRRLNLICASPKCGLALRGSYITACNKKYHVEHFSCSVCPTLFGQQDSYYEHDDNVYCHFHYSTRFATKCVGCNSAILKQFVEINRNMKDECWHPECYMIHKFWNVKVSTKRPSSMSDGDDAQFNYVEEEEMETPETLKAKQNKMEQQVYRVWTVLSAFEESSAACISDMLRHVSNGQYLDAIRMAEKFILHVEVLFAAIDDLELQFAIRNAKGMSHVREARMLCRKTVDLFTLLSRTQESATRRTGMTQELLALVTGLAHYLKILIRIALTGGLKLEREQGTREPIDNMLDKLHLLAVRGGNPTARRLLRKSSGEHSLMNGTTSPPGSPATQGVSYGFKSLAPENAGDSPFWGREPNGNPLKMPSPPSDLCAVCNLTVEEDCVRLGTYQRWHSTCVKCKVCGKSSAPPVVKLTPSASMTMKDGREEGKERETPKVSTARRPPANVDEFVFEEVPGEKRSQYIIFCLEHQHPGCRGGYQAVSRLEQYAFLLTVALRRLYVLLKQKGVIQVSADFTHSPSESTASSADLLSVKTAAHLDRKLSATARIPQRSTIVESPSGRTVQPTSVGNYQRIGEKAPAPNDQPSFARNKQPPPPLQSSPPRRNNTHPPPPAIRTESPQSSPTSSPGEHVIRPQFARNNTRVKIVDDKTEDVNGTAVPLPSDDALTLSDIPQLVEVEQASAERRQTLLHQSERPLISDLSPLELAIVKHCAVVSLQKSSLRDQFDLDEILDFVEVKKSGFWKQLFKGSGDKNKNVKKKGVFGIPLELLVERDGFDSTLGVTQNPLRVPSFIDDVVSAMKQMDMSIEGIFRKNGNIKKLKDLADAIDRDPSAVDLTTDNPVQLAALLKKFLRELPDLFSLSSSTNYSLPPNVSAVFIFSADVIEICDLAIPDPAEFKRLLHMVSILLPKSHQDTLHVLFVFLKWVASFAHVDETGNKMDLPNLATVVAPNILYAKGREPTRQDSLTSGSIVADYLAVQDDLFMVPAEFMEILYDQEYFNGALDLPSKDIYKKCDAYMKLRSNGRVPLGPGSDLMSPVLNGSHSPFNPQGPAFPNNTTTAYTSPLKTDDSEVRLVAQRSDPALTRPDLQRGRTTVSDGQHNQAGQRRRQFRNSKSLERGTMGNYSQTQSLQSNMMGPPGNPRSPPSFAPMLSHSPSMGSHQQDMVGSFPPSSRSRAADMEQSFSMQGGSTTPRASEELSRGYSPISERGPYRR